MCLPVRVSDDGSPSALLSSPPESESEVMKQREQNGQRQAEGVRQMRRRRGVHLQPGTGLPCGREKRRIMDQD